MAAVIQTQSLGNGQSYIFLLEPLAKAIVTKNQFPSCHSGHPPDVSISSTKLLYRLLPTFNYLDPLIAVDKLLSSRLVSNMCKEWSYAAATAIALKTLSRVTPDMLTAHKVSPKRQQAAKLLAFKVLVGKVAHEVNCPMSNVVRAEGNKFYRWL